MHVARRVSLLLLAIVLTGVGLAIAASPARGVAAGQDNGASDLQRQYPLGERRLCCDRRDVATGESSNGGRAAAARHVPAPSEGTDVPWLPLGLVGCGALLVVGVGRRRFAFRAGYWVRLRPRRRWPVGPRGYRLAQSLGFRYSLKHDALVLRIRDGHFGPVLRLHPQETRSRMSQPPTWVSDPPANPSLLIADSLGGPAQSHCTLDFTSLPLPHTPPKAGLWQMTAVDVQSGFVWADVVRRRNGPTAKQVATFIEQIVHELDETGRRLGALILHDPAASLFEPGLFPADVRLLAPEPSAGRPAAATAVHEELADTDMTSLSPSASLAHLRGRLRHRVLAYNTERGAPRFAGRLRAR